MSDPQQYSNSQWMDRFLKRTETAQNRAIQIGSKLVVFCLAIVVMIGASTETSWHHAMPHLLLYPLWGLVGISGVALLYHLNISR